MPFRFVRMVKCALPVLLTCTILAHSGTAPAKTPYSALTTGVASPALVPRVPKDGWGLETGRKVQGLGWLEYRSGFRVLHLQGSPYEMGYQHGALLRDELAFMQGLVSPGPEEQMSWPERLRDFFADLYHRAFVLARIKRDIPPPYLEEMRGIAAGTGGEIDVDTLVTLQLFFEAMGPSGGAFVALGTATAAHSVVHGRNLDISLTEKLRDLVTVTIYKPTAGRRFISIGWPGLVGVVQGMNDAGLSLSYGGMALDDERANAPGALGVMLSRESLQHAASPAEVLATFAGWPRSRAAAVTVASAAHEAAVIEYSPTRIAARQPDNDLLYSTTYFTSPALLPLSRSRLAAGEMKYRKLGSLLEAERGRIDTLAAVSVLRNRDETSAVYLGLSTPLTVTSVVFVPTELRFWVARADSAAPAPHHTYRAFDLRDELGMSLPAVSRDLLPGQVP